MQHNKFFIFIIVLITTTIPIQPMEYWSATKTVYAKLYAAAAQKAKQAIIPLQRAGFNDSKNDTIQEIALQRACYGFGDITLNSHIQHTKIIHMGFLTTTLLSASFLNALALWNGDICFSALAFTCTAIGTLGVKCSAAGYNYAQLFEYLKTKPVSEAQTPLFKQWIMQQDPAIMPTEKFMALTMIILEKEHRQLYDPHIFKHLITHGVDTSNTLNQNYLLRRCCYQIQNPEHLQSIAEHLLSKKANPHADDLPFMNACHSLLSRTNDDSGKTFKMFLEQKPTTQKNLTHYVISAARYNKISALMVLIQQGAPINKVCDGTVRINEMDNVLPLERAIAREDAAMVCYLLHYGADKRLLSPNVLASVDDEEIRHMLQSNDRPQLTEHLRNLEWKLLANPKMSVATHDASRTKELR